MRKIITLVSLALLGTAAISGGSLYGGYRLGMAHQSEVDKAELPKIASLAFAKGMAASPAPSWARVVAHSWGLGPEKDFVIIHGVPFKFPYFHGDALAVLPEACTGVKATAEDPDYKACNFDRDAD